MALGPCKNPNCKSHGKPHPNCKCYGGYAEGGEVGDFCSASRKHGADCELYHEIDHSDCHHGYMAEGGLVGILNLHKHKPESAIDDYYRSVKKGHKNIDDHVEHLFSDKKLEDKDHSKATKALEEWLEKGGIEHNLQEEFYNQASQQNYAEGGQVKKSSNEGIHHAHPIEKEFPEQNMLLQTTKGRASAYLSSLKPQKNQPKLAFDKEPNQKQQKKAYDKALGVAAHPLSILKKIKQGTLDKDEVRDINAMYPELSEKLRQKMVERITKDQLENKKPSYKVRLGMSLFLGVPLSSDMTPANMQAAQKVFKSATAQPQQNAPAPAKKTNALTKSSQAYLTANSAAASRQQKQ